MMNPNKSGIEINKEMIQATGREPETIVLNKIRTYAINLLKTVNFIEIVKTAEKMQKGGRKKIIH